MASTDLINEWAQVPWEEVKQYVIDEIAREEHADTVVEPDASLAKCPAGYTPMYKDNVAVLIFLKNKKEKNILFEEVSSQFGDFVFIPPNDMLDFDAMRESIPSWQLVIINAAFKYFVSHCHPNSNMQHVKQWKSDVWQVGPKLKCAYNEWLATQKEMLNMGLENVAYNMY
jgi:hypothetical protein